MPSETSQPTPPARDTAHKPAGQRGLAVGFRTQPSIARFWNIANGGKDNFKVDRDILRDIAKTTPDFRALAAANRHFVQRAAAYLATTHGIAQYVDLGVGIPADDTNLHNAVRPHIPYAKVVYVDHDPIALAHARGLLAVNDKILVLDGDIFDPADLLKQDALTAFLDWSEPIALFCTAVLPYYPGTIKTAAAMMQTYVDALPVGSCTAITHFLDPGDGGGPVAAGAVRQIQKVLTTSSLEAGWFRTRDDVAAMFPGQTLLEPGIVPCDQWRPAEEPNGTGHSWIRDCIVAGVGHKRDGHDQLSRRRP